MITPFLISILLLLLLLALPDIGVALITRRHRYRRVEDLPACDDALLLGTAKYLASGGHNVYYQYRIQAAIDLWRAGKTKRFVVSGNGLTEAVSETAAMQADLVAAGIPAGVIWQDEAGMRTLDSIVRYADTFDTPRGQRRLCMVSQPFHNQRALALARWQGMDAVGYDAQAVGWRGGWRVHLRERGARLKWAWDIVRGTAPQHSIANLPLRQCPTQAPPVPPGANINAA